MKMVQMVSNHPSVNRSGVTESPDVDSHVS